MCVRVETLPGTPSKKTTDMIKRLLLEIIDYYRDKIANDNCTEAEMRDIFALVSSKIVGDSTIADIAEHFGQSESNVRNIIARRYIGKPKRRVSYNFFKILDIVPKSWLKKEK